MAEVKTRTRKSTASPKAQEVDEAKNEAAARKAEKAEAREAAKAAKAEEAAKAKAEKEAAKAEAAERKAKEQEEARAELIESGALIVDGDTEYNLITEFKKETVAQRAQEVIETLKGSDVPVSGKKLAEDFGGGTVQWVAFFGILRVLGLVKVYRSSTGVRGGSGLAYLWTGE